jgi:hypothetical protein
VSSQANSTGRPMDCYAARRCCETPMYRAPESNLIPVCAGEPPPTRRKHVVLRPLQAAQCNGTTFPISPVTQGLADPINNRISPFIVGVSGHRGLRPDTLGHLRQALTDVLQQLEKRLAHSEVRIMTGMAAGADLLAVQIAACGVATRHRSGKPVS